MSQQFVRDLPWWTDKTSGNQLQALKVAHLIPSPRGVSIYPEDERFAAIEQPDWWIKAMMLEVGDYIVWEPGEPVCTWKQEAFEARFRPAV